jgi:competence protein ComEC
MLLAQPFYLFDIGFQLSAASTLGLVLFGERLSAAVLGVSTPGAPSRGVRKASGRLFRMLLDGMLLTGAAQLTTLPLMLAHFGDISVVTLLSNALVLPLQPPIMGLGAFAGLVGVLDTGAGRIAALPVYALLRASTWLVARTASWPWASLPVPAIGWGGALMYGVLLCAIWALLRRLRAGWLPSGNTVRRAAAVTFLVTPALALAWLWSRPDKRLHLVLRGSGAYARFPDGARLAVVGDGDLSGAILSDVPFWDRHIDLLLVPQLTPRAQAQALKILQSVQVRSVLIPEASSTNDTIFQFWLAAPYDASVTRAGDSIVLGAARLDIQMLATDRLDNPVLGMQIESQQQRVLLWQAGDVGETARLHARALSEIDLAFVRRGPGASDWPTQVRVVLAAGDSRVNNSVTADARSIDLELVSEIRAVSFDENFIIYVEQSIDSKRG